MNAGTLPSAWGTSSAFPDLGNLSLLNLLLSGTLPQSWGSNNSFPALVSLQLGQDIVPISICQLEGSLPAQWGSPSAFQQLETLDIEGCMITGIDVMASHHGPHANCRLYMLLSARGGRLLVMIEDCTVCYCALIYHMSCMQLPVA